MANALVVRETKFPQQRNSLRSAQYVRMSTDHQRYSIENQAAVIAAYAAAHGLTIVRTYRDEGESGLRIKNRAGLIRLIQDVSSGQASFDHILVYDVSRWGRFQDVDESAHYEFVCKQAGIKVAYCAEQFDNDGTMLSSIVKNIKRVMAAEYSRELSAKVHAGQCRLARLGFNVSGRVGYALRRVLVDENLRPKGELSNGDRKYLQTDHVRIRPGKAEEVEVVRWIFQQFLQLRSESAIVRELNRNAIPTSTGRPWSRPMVGRLLRNENYVGNLLFNRRSKKLMGKSVENPPDLWIRSEGCIEPIVERDVFVRAKKIIEERRVSLPKREMLVRLRTALQKRGRLTAKIINETAGLPSSHTYMAHFGTLRNAYRLIGYASKRDCDWIDSRRVWMETMAKLARQLATAIEENGGRVEINTAGATDCVIVEAGQAISFRIARCSRERKESHSPRWLVRRQTYLPPGWIVAVRLTRGHKSVLDYLLIPTTQMAQPFIRFTENARIHRGLRRFDNFEALVRSLARRIIKTPRASRTRSAPRNKASRSTRSRRKSARARH